MLKADVWRDHLLKEEASLNARLAELEGQDSDVRLDEAKDEISARLTEVHASLADMDAESGPARAAALLAGNSGLFTIDGHAGLTTLDAQVLDSLKQTSQDLRNRSVEVGGQSLLSRPDEVPYYVRLECGWLWRGHYLSR